MLSSIYEWVNPIFWPAPGAVWDKFVEISSEGYRNFTLWEHIGWSLYRILMGFGLGCLVGIPLGFAMGLSRIMRGMFDPIVEFFRPIPPLAFIPLVIIWSGIGERSKILLLFLAALWIMAIAARAGVSSVKLSKIHAAYTLGVNRRQLLFRVILPNALPEIFTGMRVAMGGVLGHGGGGGARGRGIRRRVHDHGRQHLPVHRHRGHGGHHHRRRRLWHRHPHAQAGGQAHPVEGERVTKRAAPLGDPSVPRPCNREQGSEQ